MNERFSVFLFLKKNTINFLSDGLIGDLNWIEYRELKNGAEAFKQIHNGTCAAPKIILIP